MKKTLGFIAIAFICATCVAQSTNDKEESEYNRRLAISTKSYVPKDSYVPDARTAVAIAYAVAVPIFGSKQVDEEKPFRAELKDGVWTVLGTLHCSSCVGGTLVMQIEKTSGKIVFLIHTQ
jgi:hypothetical protein